MRHESILGELRAFVGDDGVISAPEDLRTYECDGLTHFRVIPWAVVLVRSSEKVQP